MIAAVSFSFGETGPESAARMDFGKATAAAAMRESSKKRRRVGVSMMGEYGAELLFSHGRLLKALP